MQGTWVASNHRNRPQKCSQAGAIRTQNFDVARSATGLIETPTFYSFVLFEIISNPFVTAMIHKIVTHLNPKLNSISLAKCTIITQHKNTYSLKIQ
jgi:hypothetical protein